MKKLLSLVALLSVLVLASCNNEEVTPEDSAVTPLEEVSTGTTEATGTVVEPMVEDVTPVDVSTWVVSTWAAVEVSTWEVSSTWIVE